MIKINNLDIPSPTGYAPSLIDITNGERNSKGTMFLDLIAKKWKLELVWGLLTQEELNGILAPLDSGVTFNVTFLDLYGNTVTKEFYKGDRRANGVLYKDGKMLWKDFSVNLIEV